MNNRVFCFSRWPTRPQEARCNALNTYNSTEVKAEQQILAPPPQTTRKLTETIGHMSMHVSSRHNNGFRQLSYVAEPQPDC